MISSHIEKGRFFAGILYSSEDSLIQAIDLIENKIGKYDLISPGITNLTRRAEGFKLLGFIGVRKLDSLKSFQNKIAAISALTRRAHILSGYTNLDQAVSISDEPSSNAVYAGKKYYLQLQLNYRGKTFEPHQMTDLIFRDKIPITFFNDARRLLMAEMK